MNTGIPRETMVGEGRVALVPAACRELTQAGHRVLMEAGAATGSGYADEEYARAGVEIVPDAAALYGNTELVVKVKQPLMVSLQHLQAKHCVFSFLHLAPQPDLVHRLCGLGITAIAFEAIVDGAGKRPLLAPMSMIAGRLAVINGANRLLSTQGGRGILLGALEGRGAGKVVVVGAGVAGRSAVATAHAMGANVVVLDLNADKLAGLENRHEGIRAVVSTPEAIAAEVVDADIVIGSVMVAGRRAPVVITGDMLRTMQPGSIVIDIAIDQGGCVENIRATSYDDPVYLEDGIQRYAVPNMPGAVPRTASQALSAAVLPYVRRILESGIDAPDIAAATAIRGGRVEDPVLREELGL